MKYAYIAFAYLSLFTLGFIDNSRGPIYPEILKFFNISNTSGALIFSLSSLSSFLAAVFSKSWLQKLGALNSSKVAMIFYLIACLIMGKASPGPFGYYYFLIASLIFGLGVGIHSITLNLIINESSPTKHRRRVFSGLHSMYGIASLIAPFLIGNLASLNIPWQKYFIFIAIIPAVFFVLFIFLKPQNIRNENSEKLIISKYQQWILATVFACYICGEMLISTRLVVYLKNIKNLSGEVSSTYLSLFFLLLLIGRLTFTIKHFNTKSDKLLKISMGSSIISVILGIVYFPILLAVSGLTMSYFFPCAMDWLGEHFHTNMDAIFSKVMTIVGGCLVVFHWLFGVVAAQVGLDFAIWIVPVLHIIVLYILQFKTHFLAKSA